MRWLCTILLSLTSLGALAAAPAGAGKQTVCTITVNSADEKESFRRHLPASKYKFVELVERGRPDWLASACRAAVACDVLIISGHYDGGHEFFSDQLDSREFLPVAELERVSCSNSCPALFSRLKEVHLFGCNTLNPQPLSTASAEIVRSLVREGHSRKDAEEHLKALNASHAESARDRMRLVFKDVPVIYGFSSVAPLGPVAAASLNRYFAGGGAREIGLGRPSARLLARFEPFGMTVTQGMRDQDPLAEVRDDVCHFADERLSDAQRLDFVHQLLQRHLPEARLYLDRIQDTTAALEDPARRTPDVQRLLEQIGLDAAARGRFLDLARDADQPATRVRMLRVALDLGWLTEEERWDELGRMLLELRTRSTLGLGEVNLACTLNQGHELDGGHERPLAPGSPSDDVAHAAVRACLGSAEGRARTLQALSGGNLADVQIAQAYLRHRPITEASELRSVAAGIVAMPPSDAQVGALEALARHYLSDRDILDMLVRLYAATSSPSVQAAVAGILVRADKRSISSPQLVRTLLRERRPAPAGDSMIDALLRKLQTP